MKWRKMKILLGIISALIIGSCSVSQQVFIKADASGSVRIKIELKKAFINYLVDLAEVMGESFEGNFFNIEEIKKGFEEKDGVELKQIDCPRPETLEMQIQFRSVEELFSNESQLRYDSILSFDHTKEGYSLRFLLDRSNFRQVSELFPLLKNPLFEALGPQESDTTTEEEYLELIELALGEEGASGLKASFLETQVQVKGKLVSQTGGTISNNTVTFKIPLIRVLLLDKPLKYSLVFK